MPVRERIMDIQSPRSPWAQVSSEPSLPKLCTQVSLSSGYCSNNFPRSSSKVALIRPMCFSAFVDCSLFLIVISSGGSPFPQWPVHAWGIHFVDFTHSFGQLPMCPWLTGDLVVSSLKFNLVFILLSHVWGPAIQLPSSVLLTRAIFP